MGGKSGGGGTSTVTQNADPWSGVQPYLEQQLAEARRLYGTGAGTKFDQAGYNKALADWQNTGGGNRTISGIQQSRGGSGSYILSDGTRVPFESPTLGIGAVYDSNGHTGSMPTQEQFTTSSPGTGSLLAPEYYGGKLIADQSPQTLQAINALTQRATDGSPVTNAANTQVADTLNGKYLDPQNNPYFQGALNNIADAYARGTHASTDAAFNRSGAYGGSAYKEATGANNQAFANSLMDLGNTQYQQGRTQQLQAAALAPQTANQDYTNLAGLAQAGSAIDQRNQDLINADIQKYNYNANLPYQGLLNYKNLTAGTGGGSSTTTQPYYNNGSALGVGLGLLGASGGLGSLFGGATAAATGLPWLSGASTGSQLAGLGNLAKAAI